MNAGTQKDRSKKGSGLAEFGPAIGLLLVSVFFPMVDMVSLGTTYGCIFTLNNVQAQQLALTKQSEMQATSQAIVQNWQKMGLGQFCQPQFLTSQATTLPVTGTKDYMVEVSTTYKYQPFLNVPGVPGVPGLSAPMTLTVVSDRVLENSDNYNN